MPLISETLSKLEYFSKNAIVWGRAATSTWFPVCPSPYFASLDELGHKCEPSQ